MTTSKDVASKASGQLKNPTNSPDEKSVAGSALVQAKKQGPADEKQSK